MDALNERIAAALDSGARMVMVTGRRTDGVSAAVESATRSRNPFVVTPESIPDDCKQGDVGLVVITDAGRTDPMVAAPGIVISA